MCPIHLGIALHSSQNALLETHSASKTMQRNIALLQHLPTLSQPHSHLVSSGGPAVQFVLRFPCTGFRKKAILQYGGQSAWFVHELKVRNLRSNPTSADQRRTNAHERTSVKGCDWCETRSERRLCSSKVMASMYSRASFGSQLLTNVWAVAMRPTRQALQPRGRPILTEEAYVDDSPTSFPRIGRQVVECLY